MYSSFNKISKKRLTGWMIKLKTLKIKMLIAVKMKCHW
jgi:hypothetical protein